MIELLASSGIYIWQQGAQHRMEKRTGNNLNKKVPLSHWAHTHQLTVWGSCPMLPEVRE